MQGKIKSKQEIAKGTMQVTFETSETFSFKPGQYIFVTLPYLKYPDERGNRRHFSLVNSPNEKGVITFATRITNSGFKKTLQELPVGSEVELGPIAGVFTLPEDQTRPIVFIAGGIGITPFMSMLKYISQQKLPYKITLVYSNRDQSSTAFLDELQNIKLILTMTEDENWTGEKRKIDAQFIKDYFLASPTGGPNVNDNYYMVVGPPPMAEAVQNSLAEAGVSVENIKVEKFTGY